MQTLLIVPNTNCIYGSNIFLKTQVQKEKKNKITVDKFVSERSLSTPHLLTCSVLAVVDLLMKDFRAGLRFCPIKHSITNLTHILSKSHQAEQLFLACMSTHQPKKLSCQPKTLIIYIFNLSDSLRAVFHPLGGFSIPQASSPVNGSLIRKTFHSMTCKTSPIPFDIQ